MKFFTIISLGLAMHFMASTAQTTSGNDSIYRLPYKDTYVRDAHVAENSFRTMKPRSMDIPTFEQARQVLPEPLWQGHDGELEMYWRAWEIGVGNIRNPQPGSGFVAPYFDTAYNGNIFMWDSSFILMFAKYGTRLFPFQLTLDNFYAKQHPDGFICREIKRDGSDCFERYDPVSTGPNLIPWCEMEYYRQIGDMERLHKIFPVLVSYNNWLRLNRTWRNGTYWSSGWGTGMDNIPRLPEGYNLNFSHGHMIWLDTNRQQIFIDYQMLQMGFYIERWQEIEHMEDEAIRLTSYVRENLWDDATGFLYDQYADGSLAGVKTISAYWALLTDGLLSPAQQQRLVAHLKDTTEFCRPGMVPSIERKCPKYRPNGRYWQGGVWPGTNYMVMRGLDRQGFSSEARDVALKHYRQVYEVFKRDHTFYEYYSPEGMEPGFMARREFVGWTGLAPIAVFIEYILGIRADYPEGTITWDCNLTEEHGISRYPYGPEGKISFKAAARKSTTARPQLTIHTDVPFKLRLRYGGKEETISITPAKSIY